MLSGYIRSLGEVELTPQEAKTVYLSPASSSKNVDVVPTVSYNLIDSLSSYHQSDKLTYLAISVACVQ